RGAEHDRDPDRQARREPGPPGAHAGDEAGQREGQLRAPARPQPGRDLDGRALDGDRPEGAQPDRPEHAEHLPRLGVEPPALTAAVPDLAFAVEDAAPAEHAAAPALVLRLRVDAPGADVRSLILDADVRIAAR